MYIILEIKLIRMKILLIALTAHIFVHTVALQQTWKISENVYNGHMSKRAKCKKFLIYIRCESSAMIG